MRDGASECVMGVACWAQSINFRFVPNRQRILYDNVTSLCWKTALSFLSNRKAATPPPADGADTAAEEERRGGEGRGEAGGGDRPSA